MVSEFCSRVGSNIKLILLTGEPPITDDEWVAVVSGLEVDDTNFEISCPARRSNAELSVVLHCLNTLSDKHQLFQWLTPLSLILDIRDKPPCEYCPKDHR